MVNVIIQKARLVVKRFLTSSRSWLRWDSLSRSDAKVCWNYVSSCCIFWLWNLADGCQNKAPLTVSVRKGCMWYNQKGFVNPKDAKRYANSSDPSMDWSKHLGVGIYALMRWSKCLSLYKVYEKLVFARKWVGALCNFWYVYVDDILLIGNNVEFLESIKGYLKGVFSKENLDEATIIY